MGAGPAIDPPANLSGAMSTDDLRERIRQLMGQAWADLERLVAIPSVADPSAYPQEHCLQAAELVREAFAGVGIGDCKLLDMPDGHPAVFGQSPPPQGAPTVLLYSHYDVQPPMEEQAWRTSPFALSERDGRWYGRGAADCKGNVISQLTALRALEGRFPVGVKVLIEGAEEQGTGGLERFVESAPELLKADIVLVCDCGNVAVGVPTLTSSLRGIASVKVTVSTLAGAMHSGMFGGPAPDALIALTKMIATLHDERGDVAIAGLGLTRRWEGVEYPAERFRSDCGVLDGVQLIGSGPVADMLWSRPSVNVLGIDCPRVSGAAAAIQAQASARVSLRVPPGMDPHHAQDALVSHLRSVAPWGARVEIELDPIAAPFEARGGGRGRAAIAEAMKDAYGREMVVQGQGGSIPLCNAFQEALPEAEIMLLGVEEPQCLIHAPNESVDPSEIERIALVQALLIERKLGFGGVDR